jgi:glyoxylate reductase
VARVFVTRRLVGDALGRLEAAHDVEVWPHARPPTREELKERVREVDGLLTLLTDRVDDSLLQAAPRLRAIANYAVGTDNVDLEATRARNIPVGATPGVLTDATADLAFALLLAAARRLPDAQAAVRAGEWHTWEPARWLGADVAGATLGIVGFGRIGRAVARRAEGFGMEILHTKELPLDAVLPRADFISIHVPLTKDTDKLIDARKIARMKPTAILVNTARGPIVDAGALAAALHEGRLGGAALDVTDPEPLPSDHPLLEAPNLLVVPHVGSATLGARSRMTEMAVENLLAGLDGAPMPHPAD